MKILVLNSGSSSQKACLYEIGETLPDHPPIPLWEGKIEWSGDTAAIVVKNSQGVIFKEELPVSSREQVIRHLLRTLRDGKARAIASASEIDVGRTPCGPWRPAFRGPRSNHGRGARGH